MTPAWRDPDGPVEPDGRLWGGRRWTAVAAVVVLAIVAGAAVIALVARPHSAPRVEGGPLVISATRSAAGRSGAGPTTDVAGGLPLTAAPGGVAWRLVDGVALPFSASDGPRDTAGGVASGFSHSPAGALLACVQTAFRVGAVNPSGQAGEVAAMVTGSGRAGLLASRPATAPAVKPQLAGFRYLSYGPDRAVIGLAERVSDVATGTAEFVDVGDLVLVWASGDWRLVDDGSQAPLPTVLDAGLTGFVPFGGV